MRKEGSSERVTSREASCSLTSQAGFHVLMACHRVMPSSLCFLLSPPSRHPLPFSGLGITEPPWGNLMASIIPFHNHAVPVPASACQPRTCSIPRRLRAQLEALISEWASPTTGSDASFAAAANRVTRGTWVRYGALSDDDLFPGDDGRAHLNDVQSINLTKMTARHVFNHDLEILVIYSA